MRKVTNKTLSFPYQYLDMIRDEKTRTGLTASEIVRRALDLYFRSLKATP